MKAAETAPDEDSENGAASSRGFVELLCALEAPVTNNTSPKRQRTCRIAQTPRITAASSYVHNLT